MIRSARVPLKGWQQATIAVGSALGALMDPRRADLIAALGETTGKPAFQNTLYRMKRSQEGCVSDRHYLLFLFYIFFSTLDFSAAFILFDAGAKIRKTRIKKNGKKLKTGRKY